MYIFNLGKHVCRIKPLGSSLQDVTLSSTHITPAASSGTVRLGGPTTATGPASMAMAAQLPSPYRTLLGEQCATSVSRHSLSGVTPLRTPNMWSMMECIAMQQTPICCTLDRSRCHTHLKYKIIDQVCISIVYNTDGGVNYVI